METKIIDNYLFDSVLDKRVGDSDKTPFTYKQLNWVVDQQVGSATYQSGQVIIDATSVANGGHTVDDWSDSYSVLPYNVKLEATAQIASADGSPTAATVMNLNFLTSLKNLSIIDSITIEQGGRTIVPQTSNLAQFVNFKLHSTMSQDSISKIGPSILYAPDSVGSYTTDISTNKTLGCVNVKNNPANSISTSVEAYNEGAFKRQKMLASYICDTTTSTLNKVEGGVLQTATGAVLTASAGTVVFSDIHLLAIIRHKDLCDFFEKHCKLTRGVGYKIYLRVNQGTTTFTHAQTSATTPFAAMSITAQAFTGVSNATCQPAMVHVGAGTLSANLTYSNAVTISANTLKLTTAVDVGNNARLNGVRMYVPSYELSPKAHEALLAQPPISTPFMDIYGDVIQNQAAGGPINRQIASGINSPKFLVLCPQIAHANGTFSSQASALNPCPGTTDPQLSLTNIQIKVGSKNILPDRVNYDFIQFLENTSQMFGLNANQTNELSSGVIDFFRFKHNMRYYVFDLSRYLDSQDNIPKMITLEATNNSNVAIDIYTFVGFQRQCEFDIAKGSIQVE